MGSVSIGVTGAGDTSIKNAKALIEDYIVGNHLDDVVTFVLDLTQTDGQLPNGVRAAVEIAHDSDLRIEAVVPGEEKSDDPHYDAALSRSTTTVKAANPPAAVVRRSSVLLLAWQEVDGEDGATVPAQAALKALEAAERHGVPALDLTEGLLPLEFAHEGEEPVEAEEPVTFESGDARVRDLRERAAERSDESTSAVRPDIADTPDSGLAATLGDDILEVLAMKVAAAVVAELTPLFEQLLAATAPRPRGRPRKVTTPEE